VGYERKEWWLTINRCKCIIFKWAERKDSAVCQSGTSIICVHVCLKGRNTEEEGSSVGVRFVSRIYFRTHKSLSPPRSSYLYNFWMCWSIKLSGGGILGRCIWPQQAKNKVSFWMQSVILENAHIFSMQLTCSMQCHCYKVSFFFGAEDFSSSQVVNLFFFYWSLCRLRCWSVSFLAFWSRLKYLNNYWMQCHEIFFKLSWY